MQEALHKGTSPDGKATFPRLLARASGVSEELYAWAEDELARQLAMTVSSEVGFNLVGETVRSVLLCLLDPSPAKEVRCLIGGLGRWCFVRA
jgi:hypothetical protein